MQFRTDASFTIKQKDVLMDELGINPGGRVQDVIDASTIHYLRLLMPIDSGTMGNHTERAEPGLIEVRTPYAHYMNEGILYVNPKYNRTGYPYIINQKGEHVGYKGKRVPSGRPLNYHGGPNRGAHFVERTLTEHFDDILEEARKEVRK